MRYISKSDECHPSLNMFTSAFSRTILVMEPWRPNRSEDGFGLGYCFSRKTVRDGRSSVVVNIIMSRRRNLCPLGAHFDVALGESERLQHKDLSVSK